MIHLHGSRKKNIQRVARDLGGEIGPDLSEKYDLRGMLIYLISSRRREE
jgi:hypothetical protein